VHLANGGIDIIGCRLLGLCDLYANRIFKAGETPCLGDVMALQATTHIVKTERRAAQNLSRLTIKKQIIEVGYGSPNDCRRSRCDNAILHARYRSAG
jgi:hypothetical protein